jgi:hypothetical protein
MRPVNSPICIQISKMKNRFALRLESLGDKTALDKQIFSSSTYTRSIQPHQFLMNFNRAHLQRTYWLGLRCRGWRVYMLYSWLVPSVYACLICALNSGAYFVVNHFVECELHSSAVLQLMVGNGQAVTPS